MYTSAAWNNYSYCMIFRTPSDIHKHFVKHMHLINTTWRIL